MIIKSAEASCKVRSEDKFQRLEAGQVVGMAFEEVILQNLLSSLKDIAMQPSNFDRKIFDLAIHCIFRFFILSGSCPHADQVNSRLRLEFREMTDFDHPTALETVVSLSRQSSLIVVAAVKFLSEHFFQIKTSWKVFFEVSRSVVQLHGLRLNKDEFPEEDLPTQSLHFLNFILSSLPLDEVKSTFDLHSLLKHRKDLVNLFGTFLSRVPLHRNS